MQMTRSTLSFNVFSNHLNFLCMNLVVSLLYEYCPRLLGGEVPDQEERDVEEDGEGK